MSDWPESTTRWFLPADGPGIVKPINRKALLQALEQMGRAAGVVTEAEYRALREKLETAE